MPEVVLFRTEDLLPAAWRHFPASGPVRAFNPGLLRHGEGWIFAYRMVGPDGLRRIGLCRLDSALRVVPGSALPFSDTVRFPERADLTGPAANWFADPRLYSLQGRLFIYWNSGWHEPRNYQFLQELDAGTLTPIGSPRELVLVGVRQPLEKNWTLLDGATLHAIYSAMPHRVLEFSLTGHGDIECRNVATHEWSAEAYVAKHGELRGGAPPQSVGEHYWSICHSVSGVDGDYRYAPAAYRFARTAPFAPTDAPAAELSLGNPVGNRRLFPKLNPAVGEVIYPCGAAFHDGQWLVSYGINDEQCAIATLDHAEVTASLRPLAARP